MSIDVKLHHKTTYRYPKPVVLGPQTVRLRPAPHCRTPIESYSLSILPKDHFCNWQQDVFGNYLARLVFNEPATEFTVEVDLVAHMAVYNPFDFFLEEEGDQYPFDYGKLDKDDLQPYLRVPEPGPNMQALLKRVDFSKQRTVDFIVQLNRLVATEIAYIIRLEPGTQSPEVTLEKGRGSCRDSGWLLVNLLRHCGLAARFVSGYSIQLKADQEALDGPSGVISDSVDLHAWAEVYLPGAGWVGLDATSGYLCGEGHIPLACTPEIGSAAPITGAYFGDAVDTEFDFQMTIERVKETPRVTLPYTDQEWAAIDRLGKAIDARLEAADARLTMGGEPTFVSIDDFEADEWTSAALGDEKLRRSEALLKRLHAHYGKGGFLHFGQGKWYPGEPLPRWAYSSVWRKDGQPLWQKPELLADLRKDHGVNAVDAERFGQSLCDKLDLSTDHLMPAYEDAFYYMWKERSLPVNVDVLDSRLEDELERERMSKVFSQGLKQVIGYALPIERGWVNGQYSWITGPWFLRPDHCYLIPGDSPMGYRLPLDSQPWIADKDQRYLGESPVPTDVPELPNYEELAKQYFRSVGDAGTERRPENPWHRYFGQFGGRPGQVPAHMRPRPDTLPTANATPLKGKSAPWIVRTALCVEPRNGNLFVFLPPVTATEDYIDLLAAIEATADEQSQPVVLEGYLPPFDPRLNTIKVTPDPGVVEVNVQPSHSWNELRDNTKFLYEQARQCRLGTEKFQVDGRHTGTGGGNHIVVGGDSPNDSPLLRRPKLLASLVNYWHQHPSLSYLFSGMFLGPTSQAPRLDEARNDSIFELELANRELDRQVRKDGTCKPWLVDRIFRNLLTDVTGNTHRAEFCIDKLYAPESSTGRLGLLELRAFEMPPHAEMSLVQHLMLRGLISRFWEQPFEPERLSRWDTQLHDQWMLPHYVMQDMADIVDDFHRWDMPFELDWLAPHLEFRFPLYGQANYRGIDLELRQALEPWHVMGEEPGPGGTVRYVDSSVERVEIKARGLNGDRYVLTCNGKPLPLRNTGTEGEFVAGMRFRAWQPPACLHPTIGVNAPLTFDVVDTWNQTSLGGCRYHVSHPGGLSHENFPVNAYEAESRRLVRFEAMGHTPDKIVTAKYPEISRDFPLTLDLRYEHQ